MKRTNEFTITKEHLELLKNAYWEHDTGCEFGSVGTDCKRPFGNSDVYGDMAEILGEKETRDKDGEYPDEQILKYDKLYEELATVLSIVFHTGKIKTGTYVREDEYSQDWKLKK